MLTQTDTVLGVTHSLSGRRWLWRTGEERVAAGIAQRLDLPEIVSRLLAARGIGLPGIAVGNGFVVPPDLTPLQLRG